MSTKVFKRVRVKTMMTTMNYESWGTKYELSFVRAQYTNNKALAIKVMCKEEGEEFIEPYATLTVNLSKSGLLDENCAFVDTNNCPTDIIKHLAKEGVAEYMGYSETSGFCSYPCYRFSKEWLKSLESM